MSVSRRETGVVSPSSPAGAEARATGIQVVSRVAQVLRAIREMTGGASQAELADRLELPKTTVHRILTALEEEELIVAGGGARPRYRIGPEVMRLAAAAERDVVDQVHPLLVELSAETGETIDLSILQRGQVMFIDQVEGSHRLRAVSAVGETFPAHACAPGKALLAALPPSRLEVQLPARLDVLTPHTASTRAALRDELASVRESGLAFDREEHSEGISAVGVAIFVDGVQMAVSIPVPTQRFEGREEEFGAALLRFRRRVAGEGV